MGHTYYERREQPAPDVQKRKICDDCHREWSFATYEFTPEGQCPACQSANVRDIEVRGQYDSTTDPADVVRALTGVPQEKLDEEQAARQRLVKIADIEAPPYTLLAQIPVEERELAGASASRAFAPELDS